MAYAYYEKIARINLTTGEIKVEKLDVELAKKFIGGRGLGTKIVYDEGCATADRANRKWIGRRPPRQTNFRVRTQAF